MVKDFILFFMEQISLKKIFLIFFLVDSGCIWCKYFFFSFCFVCLLVCLFLLLWSGERGNNLGKCRYILSKIISKALNTLSARFLEKKPIVFLTCEIIILSEKITQYSTANCHKNNSISPCTFMLCRWSHVITFAFLPELMTYK